MLLDDGLDMAAGREACPRLLRDRLSRGGFSGGCIRLFAERGQRSFLLPGIGDVHVGVL